MYDDYHDHYVSGMGMRDIGMLASCMISLITLCLTVIILWFLMRQEQPLWH